MKKLLELEKKLIEAKAMLEKAIDKKDEKKIEKKVEKDVEGKDEKKDKKIVASALDEHNEKKHGEPKDKDSAFKDMKVKKGEDMMDDVNKKELDLPGVGKAKEKNQSMHGPVKVTNVKSGDTKVIGSVGTTKFKKSINEEPSELVKIAENGQWSMVKADVPVNKEKDQVYIENSGKRKAKPDDDKLPVIKDE